MSLRGSPELVYKLKYRNITVAIKSCLTVNACELDWKICFLFPFLVRGRVVVVRYELVPVY